ncbi:hypothetical protein H180DRAFT_05171 [Streptomyces sp. WMMB 322]|nr:hypothetical protein H180DRAFT_05171 [Streptomyces sp. WMMB 322]
MYDLELPPYRLGLAGCPDRRTTARRTSSRWNSPMSCCRVRPEGLVFMTGLSVGTR